MITVKAPERYVNEPGIIARSGEYLAAYGRRAFILAGRTALASVGNAFFSSLSDKGIVYSVLEYDGYCTSAAIDETSEQVKHAQADLIIGIGGGRVLDLAKAVGDKLELAVAAIPTIAATCAAWSALSVIYTREGAFERGLPLRKSPVLVLADTRILAEAPPRYIAAGIGDTLVKWYELAPSTGKGAESLQARTGLGTARLALEILEEQALQAYRSAGTGETGPALTEVTDAIIFLAGQVGSIGGGAPKAAIAHSVHNSLTQLPETHDSLHGEKVAFGLVVQLFLEGKSQEELEPLIHLLRDLRLPLTLQELGVSGDFAQKAAEIAKGVKLNESAISRLPFKVNAELLEKAILNADALGLRALEHAV